MTGGFPYDASLLDGLNLTWDRAAGRFKIDIPEFANIAADSVGRHAAGANAHKPAIVFEDESGRIARLTYAELDSAAQRLAAGLARLGASRGDRIAIHLGQRIEAAIGHLAVYKLGAIAVTVSQLYGPDTVRHILDDSGTKILLTETQAWAQLRALAEALPSPQSIIVAGDPARGELSFDDAMASDGGDVALVRTRAEDPALLIYSSGSTGLPKGVLHAHRVLWAYNISTSLFYNLEMSEPDLMFWTPADWAWVGGLNDTVFPAWFHGHAIVASQHRFEAAWAYDFMARHGVTHSFMTPTALKRLAQIESPRRRWPGLRLRTAWTGGVSMFSTAGVSSGSNP